MESPITSMTMTWGDGEEDDAEEIGVVEQPLEAVPVVGDGPRVELVKELAEHESVEQDAKVRVVLHAVNARAVLAVGRSRPLQAVVTAVDAKVGRPQLENHEHDHDLVHA